MEKEKAKACEALERGEGFWSIEENGVRSFLIEGSEKALLVDTGFGGCDVKGIAQSLTNKHLILVNTHVDGDHIGGNHYFEKAYLHPLEIENYGGDKDKTELVPIGEGHVFDLGDKKFEVLETPGHTSGSIMLIDRVSGMLISGDSLGQAPIFMFGERRSIDTFTDTLKGLGERTGEVKSVWPSHGPCPVDFSMVDEILEAVDEYKKGNLEGGAPPFDLPCKLYEYKRAKFLC